MALQLPTEATYLTCPRCSLVVLKGSPEDGSPFCPDCWEAPDVVVTPPPERDELDEEKMATWVKQAAAA